VFAGEFLAVDFGAFTESKYGPKDPRPIFKWKHVTRRYLFRRFHLRIFELGRGVGTDLLPLGRVAVLLVLVILVLAEIEIVMLLAEGYAELGSNGQV